MKRITVLLGVSVIFALLAAAPSQAAIITFTANLTGGQETPPNGSSASGMATVTLDITAHTLLVSEFFSGLTGGVASGAHIHCCAGPGSAAIVAVPFPIPPFPAATSGTFVQGFDLTVPATYNGAFITANGGTAASADAALEAAMASGKTYVNIHDATFPGGEIRGQLVAVTPEPATIGLLLTGFAGLLMSRRRRG
jgi:CHRD domain-containing protein